MAQDKNIFFPSIAIFVVIGTIFFISCSSLQKRQQKIVASTNERKEEIRYVAPNGALLPPVEQKISDLYPWQRATKAMYAISKEQLRCKGNARHSPKQLATRVGTKWQIRDCMNHSLPMKDGKEYVRPAMIEILSYIQEHAGPVHILIGHRCPAHQLYLHPDQNPLQSKFVIAAAVAFRVHGYEKQPWKIVDIVEQFYRNTLRFQGNLLFTHFQGPPSSRYNKEVSISICKGADPESLEGEYCLIELLWDRETNQPITVSWNEAFSIESLD